MLAPLELLELQAATMFTADPAGRLLRVNEPGGRPAPRFFIGTCIEGNRIIRARHDVPPSLVSQLLACTEELQLRELTQQLTTTHRGPAYVFADPVAYPAEVIHVTDPVMLHPALANWATDLRSGPPHFGVVREGQVVSICYASRDGERAAEAGIETAPEFRGQGLARLAARAWAAYIQSTGRIALYSTTHENTASQRVAAALNLTQYAEDWTLE